MIMAGTVKMIPAATDSPADAIVCTMLFSRMLPRLRRPLKIPIETIAAGILPETVMPA